jgi:hypothetical protein
VAAESHDNRNIGRVSPSADHDATNSTLIMAGIKTVPLVTEINFESCAEIHRV